MAVLKMEFAFEQQRMSVAGLWFHPLHEALDRWVEQCPPLFDGEGPNFQILYELSNRQFVMVDYLDCHPWKQRGTKSPSIIWTANFPPFPRRVSPEEAVTFLLRGPGPLPDHLQEVLDRMKNPSVPPLRPLAHWTGRGLLARYTGHTSANVNILDAADRIITAGIGLVQELKTTKPVDLSSIRQLATRFGTWLYMRYGVDAATWWNPDVIPPSQVGLLELRWPADSLVAREAILQLQQDWEGVLTVLSERFLPGSADDPTPAERQHAVGLLKEGLETLEPQLLGLRRAVEQLRSHAAEALAEAPPTRATAPSAQQFDIYRLWVMTGSKQSVLASQYQQLTGKLIHQGTVSRALAACQAWIAANNVLPELKSQPESSMVSVDPTVIETGNRRDGRTPRQRRPRQD